MQLHYGTTVIEELWPPFNEGFSIYTAKKIKRWEEFYEVVDTVEQKCMIFIVNNLIQNGKHKLL